MFFKRDSPRDSPYIGPIPYNGFGLMLYLEEGVVLTTVRNEIK